MNLMAFFTSSKKNNLFNMYPDPMMILGSDGKILDVNTKTAKLFNTPRYNMVGKFFSSFIQGGSTILNRVVNLDKTIIAQAIIENQKESVYLEISASQDTENDRVYVAMRDVTENYERQNLINHEYENLKNIINTKNNYLCTNSNYVLSFASSIESFSKALIDGVSGALEEKQEKYVSIINKNAKDLFYNLEKMFQMFRFESNLYECEPRGFDIINVITPIVEKWQEEFNNKKIKLNYDFSLSGTRNCYQDPNLLEYALNSLLEVSYRNMDVGGCNLSVGNPSVEFLKEKGFIDTDSEDEAKNFVLFEIKDNSNAIINEELEELFNPYYVIKNLQKRSVGTKFTYALVKKILECFGGNIWVYSKATNGVLTSFVIPLTKPGTTKS